MKLIEGMPRVCAKLIKAKGGYFEESEKHILLCLHFFCLPNNSSVSPVLLQGKLLVLYILS